MIEDLASILVTGGAGFVGSYVVRDLLALGHHVVVYDAAPAANVLNNVVGSFSSYEERGQVTVERGAISDGWRLLRIAERYDVAGIVHLASPLTQDVTADPVSGVRDICIGTAAVFEVARALKVTRVVWASSVAVFGTRDQYPPGPIRNDAPHRPQNLYGSCKSLCERMALTYREEYDVDSIGLRLTVVYGPGRTRGYMSFPSELIRRAAQGLPVEVPLADLAINWQYVEDVSATIVQALASSPPTDVAFNTSGDVRTFREAAGILGSLAPRVQMSFLIEPRDAAEASLQAFPAAFDDGELRRQLGYQPAYPLERGIAGAFAVYADGGRSASSGARV